ncbi:hypothetical protein C367_00878 [Cryptococcus neoformans Ze90-1]|nr:hypothetical protein C367_00878 [Cryptococcus neoformans var. grubii Ze90-1]
MFLVAGLEVQSDNREERGPSGRCKESVRKSSQNWKRYTRIKSFE